MRDTIKPIDQQIALLVQRGMQVEDEAYTKRVLADLGYYHLGFYWHAFEDKTTSTHQFQANTKFEAVVSLYEFEFSLKQLLLKYLRRIEINLRTQLINKISLAHPHSPTWFVDKDIVSENFISKFNKTIYTYRFKQDNLMIKKHHIKHQEKYAPAQKTLEYMTLGQIVKLYCALKNNEDKITISSSFGIKTPETFTTYLWAITETRNRCAHGNVLYDMNLHESIRKGPAGKMNTQGNQKISGVIQVIDYMVGQIGQELQNEFRNEFLRLYDSYQMQDGIFPIVKSFIEGKEFADFFC
jgi:hypothetical protein